MSTCACGSASSEWVWRSQQYGEALCWACYQDRSRDYGVGGVSAIALKARADAILDVMPGDGRPTAERVAEAVGRARARCALEAASPPRRVALQREIAQAIRWGLDGFGARRQALADRALLLELAGSAEEAVVLLEEAEGLGLRIERGR